MAEWLREIPTLPPRAVDSHKGDYGRVLIVAGSRGMAGAACLTGVGALRGGAGLVRVAVPEGICGVVAGYEPSYLTWPLTEDKDGRIGAKSLAEIIDLAQTNSVLAIGPGLGQGPAVSQTVTSLIASVHKPTVIDADGINALGGRPEPLDSLGRLAIVTPHPGEFARLVGADIETVQANRVELATEFSQRHHAITVLKGHATVVTDGRQVYINRTGNAGMATGGSGDVLTGLIAALVAQGLGAFDAAVTGVYVHGLAGDLGARELGQAALVASDLIKYLPAALRTVERSDCREPPGEEAADS
jgi:NAD(P)H-hydrate epimerase